MSDGDPVVFSDDYVPRPKTPRHLVADEVARIVKESGLAEVYGGEVTRHPDGKCYRVAFSRKRTVDGQVSIYSPTYLMVQWRTTAAGLDPQGRKIFGSLEEALAFLTLAWIDGIADAANAIPEYEPKRRKKQESRDVEQQQPAADGQRDGITPEAHLPASFPVDEFGADRSPPPVPGDGCPGIDDLF